MTSDTATRIYEQRGFAGRQLFSTGILLFAFFYGVWEIWAALTGPDSANSALFGVLFIGASLYGVARLMKDFGDTVIALDRDGGRLTATLWRPWGRRTISGPTDRFANWRFYIAIARRNQPVPLIRVDHPDHPRPLTIELRAGMALDGLRALAPEAVADYEERTGKAAS